jgi:hypothetical protein
MSETKMISKRRSPRRLFERRVGLLHRGVYCVVDAIEIGEGGMMVRLVNDVKVDDEVVVTFAIPGKKLMSISGAVRYVIELGSGKAFGLQFKELEIPYKRIIRRYVAAKSEEEASSEKRRKHTPKTYAFSVDESGRAKPTAI